MEDTIQDLIVSGELDIVAFDSDRPVAELDAALKHYQTALSSIDTDPEGSFILLYESARRACKQSSRVKLAWGEKPILAAGF